MNGNDLMNAMSGLDPKYIDEAAFELHDKPEEEKAPEKPLSDGKIRRFGRGFYIALPAAAAVLLTVTVLLSGVFRQYKNESVSYAPAEGAAADSAPAYEAEEPAAEEAEEIMKEEAAENYDTLAPMGEEKPNEKDISIRGNLGLHKAVYKDGILTLEITGILPENLKDMKYSVTEKTAGGLDKICAQGTLEDILKTKDPLTLDISELKLSGGTYTLSIGNEKVEFTI